MRAKMIALVHRLEIALPLAAAALQEELCQFTWTFRFKDVGPAGGWFPGHTFRRWFHTEGHYVRFRSLTSDPYLGALFISATTGSTA